VNERTGVGFLSTRQRTIVLTFDTVKAAERWDALPADDVKELLAALSELVVRDAAE
jgi:hypothetical protein